MFFWQLDDADVRQATFAALHGVMVVSVDLFVLSNGHFIQFVYQRLVIVQINMWCWYIYVGGSQSRQNIRDVLCCHLAIFGKTDASEVSNSSWKNQVMGCSLHFILELILIFNLDSVVYSEPLVHHHPFGTGRQTGQTPSSHHTWSQLKFARVISAAFLSSAQQVSHCRPSLAEWQWLYHLNYTNNRSEDNHPNRRRKLVARH